MQIIVLYNIKRTWVQRTTLHHVHRSTFHWISLAHTQGFEMVAVEAKVCNVKLDCLQSIDSSNVPMTTCDQNVAMDEMVTKKVLLALKWYLKCHGGICGLL